MLAKLSKRFKFSTLQFTILLFSFQYCFSAPVENIYVKFINDLNSNKCATPEQIKLPSNSTSPENVELLSSSLKICQNLDTVARIKEAQYLCSEIFDNLKVVLCQNSKGMMIKPLNITFSKQVCKDIASLKNVSENTFLLKHLTDNWSCEMLCDTVFEKACQVLHWSYKEKRDFEGNGNTNKAITGNPITQESTLDSDKQKSPGPNKAKENAQKTAGITLGQTKDTVQQPTNTFVLGTQRTNSLLEHVQNQAVKLQPNLNSDINPLHIIPNDAGPNSILPVLQDKEVKNVSQNVVLKASQEDVINNKDLPGNEFANNNAGLPEIEDPHDNEDIFPHNVEPDGNSKKEPQLPSIPTNIQLPNLPVNIGEPDLLPNNELPQIPANDLPHVNEELPQLNSNVGLEDPHDGEELGEEESLSTNSKTVAGQTQAIKIDITNPNEANVQAQATAQNGSSTAKAASSTGSSSTIKAGLSTIKAASGTTKAAASTGSTKSSTTKAEKKANEVKSTTAGEIPSVNTEGQKTTESLSMLPSLKEASSNVVSPISEDLSPSLADIEKMEGEEDAHEMPEDREPDQYTDLEKTEGDPDDDYARQEYDGIYEPAKNKETTPEKANEVEVSKVDGSQKEQTFDEFSPRNKYGPDDVPLIPVVFPEQEDGHFFFYFLSMVLILMAGYLIFHNKQKIIALIVEGRHERRRRSHGAGYKKLETK